ncbi:MAG: abortive infection family protein [Ignavibacteria bacterium]|nr:abortive infection family protein [Ignavibacteria bacterium]
MKIIPSNKQNRGRWGLWANLAHNSSSCQRPYQASHHVPDSKDSIGCHRPQSDPIQFRPAGSTLASLRNKVGYAHRKGRISFRLRDHHARLVVSLSGALALFLIQTYGDRSEQNS